MRERRLLGSVRAVPGNRHRYSGTESRIELLSTRQIDLSAGSRRPLLPQKLPNAVRRLGVNEQNRYRGI
ncbi:MAG: hypothetical protein KAI41_04530, partial [Hyphomicrobiaceae bacterium]|nr:hypothetical protein [Hyphomicrobiaceae bacterium]